MRDSVILRTAARLIVPLMLLFSIFLMLRGHNESGGGFIGGLVGASSFALYAMAFGTHASRRALRASPLDLLAVGLGIAVLAGLLPLLGDGSLLQGLWMDFPPGAENALHLGSPILFDVGVYLLVVGTALTIVYELDDDDYGLFPREHVNTTTP